MISIHFNGIFFLCSLKLQIHEYQIYSYHYKKTHNIADDQITNLKIHFGITVLMHYIIVVITVITQLNQGMNKRYHLEY